MFGVFNDSSRVRLYLDLDLRKEADDVSAAAVMEIYVHNTKTQRSHMPWQIHRGNKRKRTRNPQFFEIIFTPQYQIDDGNITWIKETNLGR